MSDNPDEPAMWPGLILENEVLRVHVVMYGGRLVSIEAPDRNGVRDHVLLGFDELAPYFNASSFGALLGPYANRIAGGRFVLDGKTIRLPRNEGANTLHGGEQRFDKKFWVVESHSATELKLRTISTGARHQFPGTVIVQATYRLEGPALWLEMTATTTVPTVLNLSVHPYFNLGGARALDIADHVVEIFADAYLPTNAAQIPTGEVSPVEGTPFDFRAPVRLRDRLRADDPQLLQVGGFDHCFVLGEPSETPRLVARLSHVESGRGLEIYTTQPGLQFYTSNKLNGTLPGRGGAYRQSAGLALEPQFFPDSPNHPNFPSTTLYPGTTWRAVNGFIFTA
jgi:aldose 1-epimerase